MASQHSIIDFFSLESGPATEFRRLLHNLQFHNKDREMKAIMVTSSMLSEGKSTVAALLALTAAKKGMKTLLIDADVRRPTIHKLFKIPRQKGLLDVLVDSLPVKESVKKTSLEKLDLITAGRTHESPADVFDAVAIGRVIQEMKFYYDIIVIDCAPVIPVSDPMLLSQEVDGILFVVKAGATQRDIVQRASSILSSSTNKLLGVILNNADGTLPYFYNHDYYGYDYSQRPSDAKDGKSGSDKGSKSGKTNGNGDQKPKNSLSR
ncbi:MAG: CpsD/CapB family tyrosine-protein kinase [bacterium]|jgi:capsular exopolysaccharide synthesis family protein|nr:CpsD/CapB family tyrosine-protein kinase [bacterium]